MSLPRGKHKLVQIILSIAMIAIVCFSSSVAFADELPSTGTIAVKVSIQGNFMGSKTGHDDEIFYGDLACAYLITGEDEHGNSIYHNVRGAKMTPDHSSAIIYEEQLPFGTYTVEQISFGQQGYSLDDLSTEKQSAVLSPSIPLATMTFENTTHPERPQTSVVNTIQGGGE